MCISEAPSNVIPIILVPTAPMMRLESTRAVPFVHGV